MQAIETLYNGYQFRSRLEARWAVFFDTLGLKYEYEPEGFKLSDGRWYLPDFRVKLCGEWYLWVEVKPQGHPPCDKMGCLAEDHRLKHININCLGPANGTEFITVDGDPYHVMFDKHQWICPRCGNLDVERYFADDGEFWVNCWPCDLTTPSGGGHPEEDGLMGAVRPHKGAVISCDPVTYLRKLTHSAETARRARF